MTTRTVASSLRAPARSAGVPILVEEELLLINRSTGRALPVTKPVGDALAPVARAVGSTVTLVSSPATELAAVRGELLRKRRAAAAVAAEHDADLVAVGAAGEHSDGLVASSPNVCGLVVRVGVPSDLAVQVCRRLFGWLPVIGALLANSPFGSGADTGHASWRFVEVHRRALGALVPYPRSTGTPQEMSAAWETAEARLPEALRYWHVRPAQGSPTVQIRAGDVGLSVDDTVAAVGLLRAAVTQAIGAARAGRPDILAAPEMVRPAQWQAARQGLTGRLADPLSGHTAPAWQVLDRFAETALPADADHEPVRAGLARLRGEGTGAERQRRIAQRTADARTALTVLARLTTQG